MRKLIKGLGGLISKLQKRGPIPASQYVPAGQKPVAMRCPAGDHSHGGFPYCHPEQRVHRAGHEQFHQEDRRVKALERKMNEIGDAMYDMAKQKKVVPNAMRANYKRIYTYLQRVQGTKRQRPINRG
ncbi:hypothetical protein LCGC14_1601890 [marine sediment metagenome]|uniref:Uncharacterized protein n=1 Tax=marine sediment metagenome TaxID=412755 RepID=A0A0F9LAZ9_9ZZZZ